MAKLVPAGANFDNATDFVPNGRALQTLYVTGTDPMGSWWVCCEKRRHAFEWTGMNAKSFQRRTVGGLTVFMTLF